MIHKSSVHGEHARAATSPPPLADSLIAGAVAGVVSRCAVAPLDVIKIRLQVGTSAAAGESLAAKLGSLARVEGVRGLFRGNAWGIVLWVSYSAVQFPVYEACRERLGRSAAPTLVSGALAATTATAVTFPLDSIRTRVVAQGYPLVYRSTAHMLREAARIEPLSRILFKGLPLALVVVAPAMAISFQVHECLVAVGTPSSLAGGVAGAVSKVATYPLDTVKRRMQSQGLER